MGGWSAEREVSLSSGRAVLAALPGLGLRGTAVDVKTPASLRALAKAKFDLAFIALHGPFGEDGTIQGFLESLGIPHTGSGVLASALAMHKALCKEFLAVHDLPTPAWEVFRKGEAAVLHLAPPVVVKPCRQGSSIGISMVPKKSGFRAALAKAFRYDDVALAERCIRGRELTVGVLGDKALPVVEIVPKAGFYDYRSKYDEGGSRHLVPAPIPVASALAAQRAAVTACRLLGCRGAARVDMMLDRGDRVHLLEVNTVPGLTPTSLLPDAARAAGLPFGKLVQEMIRMAGKRG